jgi:hypothetical protein
MPIAILVIALKAASTLQSSIFPPLLLAHGFTHTQVTDHWERAQHWASLIVVLLFNVLYNALFPISNNNSNQNVRVGVGASILFALTGSWLVLLMNTDSSFALLLVSFALQGACLFMVQQVIVARGCVFVF